MSVHGVCFDEGQSGNCGLECRGFIGGECPIPDEIADIFRNELLAEYGDKFILGVIKAQTMVDPEILFNRELKKIMFNEFGYEI